MNQAVVIRRDDNEKLSIHFPSGSVEGAVFGIFANPAFDQWTIRGERRQDGAVRLILSAEGCERALAIITPPDAPPLNKFVLTLDELAALTEPCPE